MLPEALHIKVKNNMDILGLLIIRVLVHSQWCPCRSREGMVNDAEPPSG